MSMFSVDINSAGGANYIQPKKGGAKKVATPKVPVDLTKNGSVFNDPNIFSTEATTTTSITPKTPSRRNSTTQRGGNSIFNGQMNFVSGGRSGSTGGVNQLITDPTLMPTPPQGNGGGQDDLGIGRDAGKGRKAAEDLKKQTGDLKSEIRNTESQGDRASNLGKKGKKLQASLKKTETKFQETKARELAEFNEIENERKFELQAMKTASDAIEQYTQELEAELASSDQNINRIATLRGQIREHSTTLKVGNQKIAVLGRSSKALTTQMSKTSNAYIKTNKAQQKELNENSSSLQKTIEAATKIEEISTLVETIGSTVEAVGQLFKACAGIPFVGAALAAAGAIMEPIGTTGKMVGQWGKTAGQVVKTIAYAADGQIAMAFQSAASAVQSGMSAYSSTKAAVSGWKEVDASLAEVKATAADAKADRAEAKAAKAEAKEVEKGKATTTEKTTVDADGNEVTTKETTYTDKTQAKRDKATELRAKADQKQLKANYERAFDDLRANGATSEELKQLKAEYENIQAKGIKESNTEILSESKASLLKGTSVDVKENISKQAEANLKTRKEAFAKKKADAKAKSTLKKIFSKQGGAVVAQALTMAGTIAAQLEAPACSSNCKKGGVTDFQMSQRAQKIVAQTMGRMPYVSPATKRWG